MHILYFLCCLFCANVLFAQVFVDTTYNHLGEITEIRYGHNAKATEVFTRSEMFMRNIKAGDIIRHLDSVRTYDPKTGASQLNVEPAPTAKTGNAGSGERLPRSRPVRTWLSPLTSLEGRIGMTVERGLGTLTDKDAATLLENRKDENEHLQLRVTDGEKARLMVKARISSGYETYKLLFDQEGEKPLEATVVLRGFHLNESDFRCDKNFPQEEYLDLKGEHTLYLRLRSGQKLMYIYQDGELLQQLPVGRQIDEVPVGRWKVGEYLLEIRDLGTGEKWFHGIRL